MGLLYLLGDPRAVNQLPVKQGGRDTTCMQESRMVSLRAAMAGGLPGHQCPARLLVRDQGCQARP